jgi:hypothetical protein
VLQALLLACTHTPRTTTTPLAPQVPEGLKALRSFSTADLAAIEEDRSLLLSKTAQVCCGSAGAWG